MFDKEQIIMDDVMAMDEKIQDEQYQAFVNKFKPKKTTDDCYTPQLVYEAVSKWVSEEYKVDKSCFLRPFWPEKNYKTENYTENCVVVDNPPFSIFTEILKYYSDNNIRFFLFGPSLTLTSSRLKNVCYICTDSTITYENGATIKTGFATNLDKCQIRSAPTLYEVIKKANDETQKSSKAELPKYEYPLNICTPAIIQKYSRYGIDFRVLPNECCFIKALDEQKKVGKTIFGSGVLLSERAAAERAAAERAAAERANVIKWQLSEREWAIVKELNST